MREARIWPNGLRYLWTDAFGVVLLVSLWRELRDDRLLRECEWVVAEVERVLGRPRGLRIGEEPDRDGQYFHYLAMWIFALDRLGAIDPRYREKAIALARDIHPAFVVPGVGVHLEDAGGPERTLSGLRARRAGCLSRARRLSPRWTRSGWRRRSRRCEALVESSYRALTITQDLGLGMMLWMSHFFPRRTVGGAPARAVPRHAGPDVDRSARLLLPRAGAAARQVRLHQLWRLARPPGRARARRSGAAAECVLRRRIAPATSTMPMPSRTSWRARPIGRAGSFGRPGRRANSRRGPPRA